ncbi:TonB-dependent receptor [candidate division WOR-3 bacterium]|nr:TonB-dependent receptor [candidate division WOR-3 bacterium]
MRKRARILLVGLLVLTGIAWAANTGSVIGRVTDKKTGEALIGASVVVDGTELGYATDLNGQYQIINVPPGRYSVTASYTGYNEQRVTDVLVIQDNPTTVDFQLSVTVIDIGRTIDVVAKKTTLVQRTNVVVERVITDEDFKRLPVTGLSELVGLQAGVTQSRGGGWTHIRGGRFDDVAYLVDGVAAQDALVGTLWSSPKPTTDALQSVVVITGGFDAEYGSAMSGIIKAVTKEGGSRTTGRVGYTTDDIFPHSTGYNFGYNRVTFSLGGPTPIWKRLRYFLSAEYFKTDDDANVRYKINSPRGEYALEGKLTVQMPQEFFLSKEGLKFTVDGYHSNYQWWSWGNAYKYYQQSLYANRVRSYKANFTINHLLSKTTVYEAKIGWFQTSLIRTVRDFNAEAADTTGGWGALRKAGIWDRYIFRAEDWVFNNWEGLSKRDAVLQLYRSYWLSPSGDTVYAHPGKKNFASAYALTDNPWGVAGLFITEGDNRTWHYRSTDQVLGKFDLTHTVSKIHEIKTGIDLTQYSLSIYENSLPWDQNPFWDAYNYKPLVAAAYIQDRADFEDLVVRAGIRFDYLESKANVRAFPESLGARNEIADSLLPVPAKYRLAPRLGLSYPITERIKFRFSYGHFYKNPSFSDLYTYADRTAAELRSRGNVIVGNADMGAEKTVAYEMGFDAQVSDIFAFDVTAFYKDVFDLAGVRVVQALPQPYTMYYNVEYARIQGFEATMTKALNQYWSSRVGYTFQIAKGTASTAEAQYQRETPRQLDYFLDQDVRHSFHGDLAFSFPSDFTFVPLRDFEVSGVFSYGSGTPYTPTDQKGNQIGLTNSARLPGSYALDGRLSKDFTFAGMALAINCDITNILNTEIVTNVFSATGKPDYTGRVITPYEFSASGFLFGDYYYHPARDYNHDGFITRSEQYASYLKAYTDANTPPTYYGPPRKFKLGLSLSF